MRRLSLSIAMLLFACGHRPQGPLSPKKVTVSIVGTNDLHGRLESLPILGGYVANLRAARSQDGGAVVLVDAGDLFQGTLESNLAEGEAVIRAYNAMGFAAAAVGNHEFDFGPAGPATTPRGPSDDPQGALKTRAQEARFPFLAANILDEKTGQPLAWPNVVPSHIYDAGTVRVGILGVTTLGTPRTTIAANFRGLAVAPLTERVVAESRKLRASGAQVVVVLAHAGGKCLKVDDPANLSTCEADSEVLELAKTLPRGAVDAIVAGHTHAGMAHLAFGIPIIESFANGRAFGRIDLVVDRELGRVTETSIHPPHDLCPGGAEPVCAAGIYEGKPVVPDAGVGDLIAPFLERARHLREEALGVALESPIWRRYDEESPLGNLFADLMRAANPDSEVAMTNGGGIRADLPEGRLTYGQLYEAFPFDNRFATLRLRAAELRSVLSTNLRRKGGILSLSGVRAIARCQAGHLDVALERENGTPIGDDEVLALVTSDFLATGGDGAFADLALPDGAVSTKGDIAIRDAMATLLRTRGGILRNEDLFRPEMRRFVYPGARPVICE